MQRPQVRDHSGRVHQPGSARRHPQLGRSPLLQAPAKDQGAVSGPAVPSGRQRKEQTAEALRQHVPLRRRSGCIRSQRRWNCQGKLHWVRQAFLCAHHFCPKRKMFTFFQSHSHASTIATRLHEYFREQSRLLPVPGVLVSFVQLRFPEKTKLKK